MLKYHLAWAQTDFLSKKRLPILEREFGDLATAWKQITPGKMAALGIFKRSIETFFQKREKLDLNWAEAKFNELKLKLLFYRDADYPKALKEIAAPPIFLFVLGDIKREDDLALAVVGSRKLTDHGRQAVEKLLPNLAPSRFTIVSGLARGVDTLAHQKALDLGLRTIAVLGSGLDKIWPTSNQKLAQKISQNGALISEFALGTEPLAYNFPRRNRIISGLCRGILVIEGKQKSGSLITAQTALEQNREVFAVPGSPFVHQSQGPNLLIQESRAKLVQSAEDILTELNLGIQAELNFAEQLPKLTDPVQKQLFELLNGESRSFDELVIQSKLDSASVSTALTILEMKGLLYHQGLGQWRRVN
jgi:DNA processing protein